MTPAQARASCCTIFSKGPISSCSMTLICLLSGEAHTHIHTLLYKGPISSALNTTANRRDFQNLLGPRYMSLSRKGVLASFRKETLHHSNGKVTPLHATNAYGGNWVNLQLYSLLTSVVGGQWPSSHPSRLTPGKNSRQPWNRRLGGSSIRSGSLEEQKPLIDTEIRNRDRPARRRLTILTTQSRLLAVTMKFQEEMQPLFQSVKFFRINSLKALQFINQRMHI